SAGFHFARLAWSPGKHPHGPTLTAAHATSPDNISAACAARGMRWDRGSWRAVTCPDCLAQGIWTNGPSDSWVVGPRNMIGHWDGSQWSLPPCSFDGELLAVWGSAANDVWFAGVGGVIAHWDGTMVQHRTSGSF